MLVTESSARQLDLVVCMCVCRCAHACMHMCMYVCVREHRHACICASGASLAGAPE